jgi:hypothetical protein
LVVDWYTVTDKSIELPHWWIVFFEDWTWIVELDEPFVFHKN